MSQLTEHSHTIDDVTGTLRSVSVDNNPERHVHELKIELNTDDILIIDVGKPFFDKETNKLMISITAKLKPEYENLIDALNRIGRLKKISY